MLGRSKVMFLIQSIIRETHVQKVICTQMFPKLLVHNFWLLLLFVYYKLLLSENLNEVKVLWTPLTNCIRFWNISTWCVCWHVAGRLGKIWLGYSLMFEFLYLHSFCVLRSIYEIFPSWKIIIESFVLFSNLFFIFIF